MPETIDIAPIAITGRVSGKVQGVFFRVSTQARARELGLSGWVRNTVEGDVELLIAGPESAIAAMQDWLRHGPRLARVDTLELVSCEVPDISGFEIRY